MKLRNKKTGYVGDFDIKSIKDGGEFIRVVDSGAPPSKIKIKCGTLYYYDRLAELNEEWEDYKPKEPLIKDEKIRKAVRAWAEALEENTIRFDRVSQGFSFGDGNLYSSINFDGFVFNLVDGKKYTITELCGEEEE